MLLLIVPCLVLAFFLRHEAGFSGFQSNDLVSHVAYIHSLLDSFRRGSLGLDAWFGLDSFGAPVFRTYQNLSHLVGAALCFLFRTDDATRVAHLLIVFGLIAQPLIFYRAARQMGLRKSAAIAAGWLALLISSSRANGHELKSYIFVGFGLLPQIWGVNAMLLAIGSISGAVAQPESAVRRGLAIGGWTALTFLFHHFFGYMTLLYLGAAFAYALAARWLTPKQALRILGPCFLLFAAATGYQLLSIAQDSGLMQKTLLYKQTRWDGFGLSTFFSEFFGGELFDFGHFPILTWLVVLGFLRALRPRASRAERAPVILALIGVFFCGGRVTFGHSIDLLPGARFLHLERFIALVHVAGIFLAALALGWLVTIARERRFSRIFVLLGAGGLTAGLATAVVQRIEYLQFSDERVLRQQENERAFDRRLFTSVEPALRTGSLWSYTPFYQDRPQLGFVSYYSIATKLGFSQLSSTEQMLLPISEVVYKIDPTRPEHCRLFGIAAVMLKPGSRLAQSFYRQAYRGAQLVSYLTPPVTPWQVIGITGQQTFSDSVAFDKALDGWLKDPALSADRFPSFVPERIARRWPSALAAPSPAGFESWGSVVRGTDSRRATLVADHPGAYGMLRVAYHPRWQVRVNGAAREPKWAGPGFLAFALDPGTNEVEVSFPADPRRALLFFFGLLALVSVSVDSFCSGLPRPAGRALRRSVRYRFPPDGERCPP